MGAKRKKFTQEEDAKLKELFDTLGENNLELIAMQMPRWTLKQIRERYVNYIKTCPNDTSWTDQEDELLKAKFEELGSNWKVISTFFQSRKPVSIKNRFLILKQREQKIVEDVLPPYKQDIKLPIINPVQPEESASQNFQLDDPNDRMNGLEGNDQNELLNGSINGSIISMGRLTNNFYFIRELGKGGNALVELVERIDTHEQYAAKIIPLEHLEEAQRNQVIRNETSFIMNLNHENIIKYETHFFTDDNKYLIVILELCDQDLFSYIFLNKDKPYIIKNIICDIVSAIQYLHKNHIVHRDIKPENIMIKNGRAILTDFGHSLYICQNHKIVCKYGTSNFESPESIRSEAADIFKSDICAFGITCYLIATGDSTIYDQNESLLMHRILYEELPIDESDELQNLAKWCTTKDPSIRPTIDQVLKHNYFQ